MSRMRHWWHWRRSWWYWRRFESPGRTVDQQEAFARIHLSSGSGGAW